MNRAACFGGTCVRNPASVEPTLDHVPNPFQILNAWTYLRAVQNAHRRFLLRLLSSRRLRSRELERAVLWDVYEALKTEIVFALPKP